MLCSLNKAKVIFKGSSLSNAKWDTFIPSKEIFFCWAFSFVLFTVHVVRNVQVASKLSPRNHFITKHILFLKKFHQLS